MNKWESAPIVENFDPEGADYDYQTAIDAGEKADETGHWGSLDPRTGMLLKGINHPTIKETMSAERALGNEITKGQDGRYYSKPLNPKAAAKWQSAPEIEPETVTSEDLTPDELNRFNESAGYGKDMQTYERAMQFLNRPKPQAGGLVTSVNDPASYSIRASELSNWELMEVLAQSRDNISALRFKGERDDARAELRRRNVPNDLISAYMQISEPTGFVAGLKSDAAMIAGTGVASLAASKAYPQHPLLAPVAAVGAVAPLISYGQEKLDQWLRPETARYGADVAKEMAVDTISNALGEVGGYGLGKALTWAMNPFGAQGSIKRGAAEASEQLKDAGKRIVPSEAPAVLGISEDTLKYSGVTASLTPAQKYANSAIAKVQSIAENSVSGSGRIFDKKRLQLAGLGVESKEALNALTPGLGSYVQSAHNTVDDISKQLAKEFDAPTIVAFAVDHIKGAKQSWKTAYGAAYRALDEVPGVGKVNITSAQRLADDLIEAMKPYKSKAVDDAIAAWGPDAKALLLQATSGNKGTLLGLEERKVMADALSSMSPDLTFEQAIALRSDVLELGRKLKDAGVPKAERIARQFSEKIDSAMEQTASESGILNLWRRANHLRKAGEDRFENNIIQTAVRKTALENTQGAANRLLTDSDSIRRVKKVLTSGNRFKTDEQIIADKLAFQKLRDLWVADQWLDSTSPTGLLDGFKLKKRLDDFGHNNLAELFTDAEIKNLYRVAETGVLITGETEGGLSTLVHMLQGTAIAGAASGVKPVRAMATLGVINGMGRIISDDTLTKVFVDGLMDIRKYNQTIKSLGAQAGKATVAGIRGADDARREALMNEVYRKEGQLFDLMVNVKKQAIADQRRYEALLRREETLKSSKPLPFSGSGNFQYPYKPGA